MRIKRMYTQLKKRYFISLLEKISENKKIYEFTIAMHSRGRENDMSKNRQFLNSTKLILMC